MRCPFLREAQVKNCQASNIRKMIVRSQDDEAGELCSTPDYIHCQAIRQCHEDHPAGARCPFLHESLMQYCAASPVTKYVPYSDSSMLKCGSDNHRYCDAYLAAAMPEISSGMTAEAHSASIAECTIIDGISIPGRLSYAANHLWLDLSSEGICHIGIDGVLARTLPPITEVHFSTTRGTVLPAVVLRAGKVDIQLIFPVAVAIAAVNTYLRATPDRIRTDPYRTGWLFEGTLPRSNAQKPALDPTLFKTGADAVTWMRTEITRLNRYVGEQIIPSRFRSGGYLLNDGGELQEGFATLLEHHELLSLFNEFFSPHARWRTQE